MVQSRGRPALGEGKSLKMTVLVEQEMLDALEGVMQEMRGAMPGVRIDRSTAVRHVLSKALALYRAAPSGPGDAGGGPQEATVPPREDQLADQSPLLADHSDRKAAPPQDQHRTTGKNRQEAAHSAEGVAYAQR